jgi:hypothetical protein
MSVLTALTLCCIGYVALEPVAETQAQGDVKAALHPQFLAEYGAYDKSCDDMGASPSGSLHIGISRLTAQKFVKSIYNSVNLVGAGALLTPMKGSMCSALKLLPVDSSEAIADTTLLQVAASQESSDVTAAIIMVALFYWLARGMYAKMWCENFFVPEVDAWKADPSDSHVDANYAPLDWEKNLLEQEDANDQKEAAKKANKELEKKGMGRVAAMLQWHHPGPWPSEGGWTSPLDPFDTVRSHHRPAAHYVRVYCQEMHYWFGWRVATVLWDMFKSNVYQLKKMKEEADKLNTQPSMSDMLPGMDKLDKKKKQKIDPDTVNSPP